MCCHDDVMASIAGTLTRRECVCVAIAQEVYTTVHYIALSLPRIKCSGTYLLQIHCFDNLR